METRSALHPLIPMSEFTPVAHPVASPNTRLRAADGAESVAVKSSDNTPALVGRAEEGDRGKNEGRKRDRFHQIGPSKRRRLGGSKRSRNKEGDLLELINGATEAPQDLLVSPDGRGGAAGTDLAVANEVLAPKAGDLIGRSGGKDISNLVAEADTGAAIETPKDHNPGFSNAANISASREQSASNNQDTAEDKRILRPRRELHKFAESSRILKEVALSGEDSSRIVGRRIKVYWPLDDRWYFGLVKDYDASKQLHRIVYDDHDEEWLLLHKERFKLQVFPGETFGQMGRARTASSGQILSEQHQEGAATESVHQWNVEKDGNVIGDDVLLSVVAARNGFKGAFRKKLHSSNETSLSVLSPLGSDDGEVSKQCGSRPPPEASNDDNCTLKTLATRARGASDVGARLVPNSASLSEAKMEKAQEGVEKHVDRQSSGKRIPTRASSVGRTANINYLSVAAGVRRHSNRKSVRSPLAEVAADGEPVVVRPVRNTDASAASDGGVLGVPGEKCQQEHARKTWQGSQLHALDTNVKLFSRPSSAPRERHLAQRESRVDGANVAVNVYSDSVCRSVVKGRERQQLQATIGVSPPCSGHMKSRGSLIRSDQDMLSASLWGIAVLNCKINLGHQRECGSEASSSSRMITNVNGFIAQGKLELHQLHAMMKSKLNLTGQDLQRDFHSSIHLLRLDVVLDLFTRQLFNILKQVGLCNGDSFEERISMNGSFQDFMGIIRLLLTIIKKMPLSEWIHQRSCRHWQGRIVHELWSVLSGSDQWFGELPRVLPTFAENLLAQHLRGFFLECNGVSCMTYRQMLNILVCYFIKPYVIATVCERGAMLTVLIQRFLLPERTKSDIQCLRQSVRSVKLRSGAGADLDFSSYLDHFPVSNDWRTENGFFQNQMKKWIATTAGIGYAEESTPVPAVKYFSPLGLQVTSAHVFAKELATGIVKKVFFAKKKCGDPDGVLRQSIIDCLRLTREVRDGVWDGRFGFQIKFCKAADLFSGLFLTSMLQKSLHLAASEAFASVKASTEKGSTPKLVMGGLPTVEVKSRMCKPGNKTLNQRMAKSFKRRKSQSGIKVNTNGATGDQTTVKRAKLAADAMRTSSFWMKHNAGDAVECESGQQINDGSVAIQSTGEGALQSARDVMYLTSGSPSESILFSRSTAEKQLGFRPQLIGGQSFSDVGKDLWIDPNMASYYSRVLDRRKHKGEILKPNCPVYNDLLTRRPCKKGRPLCQGSDQTYSSCSANVLVTKGDRGWREHDVKVELQCSGSECLIAVQGDSGKMYTHKVQQSTPTGKTNRHTRAVMWKGGNSWTLEFQDRKQWNLFKNMYEECGHRKARVASAKQIPIPGVREVDDFDGVNLPGIRFHRSPYGYIRQTEGEVECALKSTHIIYNLDSEDEAWLTEVNGKSNNVSSKSFIMEENFERIIDKLEKIAYMRQGVLAAPDEAIEICQDLGSATVVRDVYMYWSKKRLTKGTALVRQFQPPLWEQYKKQLQNWQAMFNELQLRLRNASKEQLLEQCPQPPMFSFCLPPRGLDANTLSKKLQKQRSQRKLSAVFKYSQASSLSDSSGFE